MAVRYQKHALLHKGTNSHAHAALLLLLIQEAKRGLTPANQVETSESKQTIPGVEGDALLLVLFVHFVPHLLIKAPQHLQPQRAKEKHVKAL